MREQLEETLSEIEKQISVVKLDAASMAIDPYALRDTSGAYVMVPLLTAKASVLSALADLL